MRPFSGDRELKDLRQLLRSQLSALILETNLVGVILNIDLVGKVLKTDLRALLDKNKKVAYFS